MPVYSGRAVGGPLHGEPLRSATRTMEAAILPRCDVADPRPPKHFSVETGLYCWNDLRREFVWQFAPAVASLALYYDGRFDDAEVRVAAEAIGAEMAVPSRTLDPGLVTQLLVAAASAVGAPRADAGALENAVRDLIRNAWRPEMGIPHTYMGQPVRR